MMLAKGRLGIISLRRVVVGQARLVPLGSSCGSSFGVGTDLNVDTM